MRPLELFTLPNGKVPFEEWFKKQSPGARVSIDRYVQRLRREGASHNVKPVGDGVFEVKIDKGPGFRVYFCTIENVVILLLLGGDKSTQKRDIEKAKSYRRSIHA